jgi:hypothetical protein
MSNVKNFLRAALAATVIVVGAQHAVVMAADEDEITDQGGGDSGTPDVPDVPDGGDTGGDAGGDIGGDTGGDTDSDTDTGNTDDDDSGTGDSGDDDTSGGAGTNDDSNDDSGDVSSVGNTPNVQTSAANGPLGAVTVEAALQKVLGPDVDVTSIINFQDQPLTIPQQVSSQVNVSTFVDGLTSNADQNTIDYSEMLVGQVGADLLIFERPASDSTVSGFSSGPGQ